MNFQFKRIDDNYVEDGYHVLAKVGKWLESEGRRQRISKISMETYQGWQLENANYAISNDKQIVGVVSIRSEVLQDWPNRKGLGKVSVMRGLATDPDFQGLGIGKFAINCAIELCSITDSTLYLDCVSDSLPRYYEGHGFRAIDQQVRTYEDGETYDITLMSHSLQ